MMYKAEVAVCSDIRTKHLTRSERHVEFLILNLVVRKITARLLKVNHLKPSGFFIHHKVKH